MAPIRYICPMPPRNLVNLHSVAKGYAGLDVLHDLTLASTRASGSDRRRNGAGKSTLMRMIVGAESPDAGRHSHDRA